MTLICGEASVGGVAVEPEAELPRSPRSLVSGISLVVALVALVVAILLVRGWRPSGTSAAARTDAVAASMPISAEIEAKYGIRFTSVDITAGGGMIQLQYQVLDADKTLAIHDAAVAPVVIDSSGVKYADPGMVGHTHVGKTKMPGTTDFILLANSQGGVRPGSIVTVKVGDLELRNIVVL